MLIAAINSTAEKTPKPLGSTRLFIFLVAALVICFALPLYRLGQFALGSEFYSYVILMPLVCGYLARVKKPATVAPARPLWLPGLLFAVASAALMLWRACQLTGDNRMILENDLSFTTFAFFIALIGVALLSFGRDTWQRHAFPLGMLLFAVPLPLMALEQIETFLQYGSAFMAEAMLKLSGMHLVRNDLILVLPNISLNVMPECSGIHSTWILLITSFLAAYLFLRSPVRRVMLVAFVLPLALLRNGFRIFVIGQLCVRVGPEMIHHWIHHRGGPVFFALSLIPFFLLLVCLYRAERKKTAVSKAVPAQN